ncbi:MAG TPA: peroxiredoxin [Thermoplasmata archaeon]|nr:peroxiredoxin [Thermoplasmata archaeon]
MIAEGEMAPDFEGPTSAGSRLKLSELRGHPVILYFYPQADTPGCTREGKGFRDHFDELGGKDVRVIGVSTDDVEDEAKFAKKYGFQFPLVADPNGEITGKYGVKGLTGRAKRVTFLIQPDGRVAKVIASSDASNHVDQACEFSWPGA